MVSPILAGGAEMRMPIEPPHPDGRLSAPAADRNKGPILEVLKRVLPERGFVLEIASGTGQHVVHFAAALRQLQWQPSEPDPDMRSSIAAWIGQSGLANVLPPLDLDVCAPDWPIEHADAVLCINMAHITPWRATLCLLGGAARVLSPGGVLILYGPYRRNGRHTAPSNESFDRQLRGADPEWGVRDMEAVEEAARQSGLIREEIVPMPANNFTLVLRME